jgi:MFS family permease
MQLGAILFMAAGIVAAGVLSDRYDSRRVLIGGCLGTVAVGMLLAPLFGSGSAVGVFLFLALALLAMGFVYGPLGAWLPGLFPAGVRYTGASIAFNVGGILGGGVAPLAAQAMAERGGLAPVGWYLAGCAAVSLIALLAASRSGTAVD